MASTGKTQPLGIDSGDGRRLRTAEDVRTEQKERLPVRMAFLESLLQACDEKEVEYGSADLEMMSFATTGIGDSEFPIAFYALGKTARIVGAFRRGDIPSDDSWKDLATYALMAIFARKGI